MAVVYKRDEHDTLDSMLKRFKSQVDADGLYKELKAREFYVAPAEKKRLKKEAARKRKSKEERKLRKYYGD